MHDRDNEVELHFFVGLFSRGTGLRIPANHFKENIKSSFRYRLYPF